MQARYVAALLGCAALACAAAGRGVEAVPFYMYSGPAYDWVKNCSANYRSELDALRHAFHAGEILFQEQLAHHPERVYDDAWERARVFVVPTLFVFAAGWTPRGGCGGLSLTQQLDATGAALLVSPCWRRQRGRDHLIVADHFSLSTLDEQLQRSPSFYTALRNMTIGHFETGEHQGERRAWRCTIAVPYTHIPLEHAHARRGKQTAVRDMGAFFMGKVDFAGDYQLRREVAAKVTGLTEYNMTFISTASDPEHLVFPACDVEACWSLPRCVNCSVLHASRLRLYAHRLARSDFALMVRGDSPSSRRLYDALAYGAVPIIISDRLWHVAMPFPGKVPWPDLVYALDEGFTAEEFRRVMDAPREALLRKRALIRRHLLDLSWHAPGSRVVGNILAETARYCLQPAASA